MDIVLTLQKEKTRFAHEKFHLQIGKFGPQTVLYQNIGDENPVAKSLSAKCVGK